MAAGVAPASRPGLRLLSRVAAAIVGGYALASACAVFLAAVLPMSRAEAVATGSMAAFAVYTGAVVWVFAASSPGRAWWGLLLPAAVLGAAGWLLA
jgi:hypothetical protein